METKSFMTKNFHYYRTLDVSDHTTNQGNILKAIAYLEFRKKIRIIFAVEQGPRLYGFHGSNSNFSLKVIFVRRMEDYFSVKDRHKSFAHFIRTCGTDRNINVEAIELGQFLNGLKKNSIDQLEQFTSHICYYGNRLEFISEINIKEMCLQCIEKQYRERAKHIYTRYVLDGRPLHITNYIEIIRCALNSLYIQTKIKLPPHNVYRLLSDLNLTNNIVYLIKKQFEYHNTPNKKYVKRNYNLNAFLMDTLSKEADIPSSYDFALKQRIFDKLYLDTVTKYNELKFLK